MRLLYHCCITARPSGDHRVIALPPAALRAVLKKYGRLGSAEIRHGNPGL
jgi:hypothetical protein